jgi:hypothetical protein
LQLDVQQCGTHGEHLHGQTHAVMLNKISKLQGPAGLLGFFYRIHTMPSSNLQIEQTLANESLFAVPHTTCTHMM